jgi:ubiquinone/menaquinone biosynthesis C-methylase UbiE
MRDTPYSDSVNAHYTGYELAAAIAKGLDAIGKGDAVLTPDDLAPIDQFHTRGTDATVEMIELAGAAPDTRVLDVGGGIGGAARLIASTHGSRVTVLDLTEDFCRVGEALTARAHLSSLVSFRHGSALDLPFASGSFDLVWTQHSTMNVPDKAKLFRELARVAARTGRIAMHEVMAGPQQPVLFPVPWARTPDISFLVSADEFRAQAAAAGLKESVWRETSDESLEWFRARTAAMRQALAAGQRPPLGLHLILGDDFPSMFANLVRNLEEQRVRIIMGIWTRM